MTPVVIIIFLFYYYVSNHFVNYLMRTYYAYHPIIFLLIENVKYLRGSISGMNYAFYNFFLFFKKERILHESWKKVLKKKIFFLNDFILLLSCECLNTRFCVLRTLL